MKRKDIDEKCACQEKEFTNDIVFARYINYMRKALLNRRLNYLRHKKYLLDVDIFVLKRILGHKSLDATQIYTHVSNKKMKEIMMNCTISSIIEKMEEN